MRILASSDLHYNIQRSKEPARDLARKVVRQGGDVFILAGDIAGIDPEYFSRGLELFSGFKGKKLLVVGNHDLWVKPDECSFEKWTRTLPALSEQAGFDMLDHRARIIDNVGFVGNIGWYDYSFRDERLEIPSRFYEAKISPGRAWRVKEYHHLLDPQQTLTENHLSITSAWRDGEYVNLPFSDIEFVECLIRRLETDVETVDAECDKVVAVFHHLPCRDLVWYRGDSNWDFAAAFLGSQRFEDVLDRCPSLRLCLCGHNHRGKVVKRPGLEYITIGSTYLEKELLEFDV